MPPARGLFMEIVSDLLPMLDMEDSLIKVFDGLHYYEIYDILLA